jgi:S-DNA-T family DNA segregation ATPase FtsK/SpoIIIE
MGFDNFTISKISPKIFGFLEKRLIELVGIILILLSIFFFVSLASYSPTDPNFIYSEKGDIKNIFGFPGSVVSDFILQSIGLVGFLFSLSVLIWGINIVLSKNFSSFLQKVFFSIIYILFGTSAMHIYKAHSFWLFNNGNGGFVGKSVSDLIFNNINFLENNYIIIILSSIAVFFFFASIALKIKHVLKFIKIILFAASKFFLIFSKKKNDIPTKINVTESEENKNINTQPGLPFTQKK